MKRTLGLDLGTASIGWAVIDVPETDEEVGAVVAMGSRIFEAGAEVRGSIVTTAAASRRTKRAQRRQLARRSRRRRVLRDELVGVGLLPSGAAEFTELMDVDPAALLQRSDAGGALELFEIGRVVYWLASRRGFLSLRSGGGQVLDDGDEGFVPNRYRLSQYSPETGERVVRGQEDVLIDVLKAQQSHHPSVITEELIFGRRGRLNYPVRPIDRSHYQSPTGAPLDEFGIHGLMFFQRSIYWRESTVAACSLDVGARRPRAPRADRLSQTFILWQLAINLRVGDPERALDEKERQVLVTALSQQGSMSFGKVRKVLGLPADLPINLERGDRTGLDGHRTDAVLRAALKTTWNRLDDTARDRLVHLLLGDSGEEQLRLMLVSEFGFTDSECTQVLKAALPPGRMAYSRSTVRRLLPHMATASNLRDAIKAAGFPSPEEARAAKTEKADEITNPLVRSTLQQLGKLLDALEKRFERADGTAFDTIRIELSRDVSNSRKDRERITKEQRQNERERQQARKLISEWAPGNEENSEYIRRVRLWNEQQQQCLYSGTPISAGKLFTNEVQVDHILPRSKTLDNGMSNVAVVWAQLNLEKGDRTLTEWRGEQFAEQVAERARAFKFGRRKVSNLLAAHVPEDAIPQSLLASTGYINAVARDFVRQRTGVVAEVSRGRLTRALLYRLGLHKDQGDHRRHALDAAMVALTTPVIANRLAREYKSFRDKGAPRDGDFGGWEPWPGCRTQLLSGRDAIIVSHRVRRKVSGQLHEETHYGKVRNPHIDPNKDLHARRKSLVGGLSSKELTEVADPAVRSALVADLVRRGLDPTVKKLVFDADDLPRMADGQIIRRVRLHKSLPDNRVIRASQPRTTMTMSRNHSAAVIENTVTKGWRVVVMARFDAAARAGLDERSRYAPGLGESERLLFTLIKGDTLFAESESAPFKVWKVQSLELDGRIKLEPVHSDGVEEPMRCPASKMRDLQLWKVTVTMDGQLRRARD